MFEERDFLVALKAVRERDRLCKDGAPIYLAPKAAQDGYGEEVDAVLLEPKAEKPPFYQVLLLNDDYTPMDFVVEVLQTFFNMDLERAVETMLTIHYQGKAVCGIYIFDVAATKAQLVNQYARECQHPLLCNINRLEQ